MNHELVIRPEAEDDLTRIHAWYEQQRAGLGSGFILSFEALIAEIRRRPTSFPLVHQQVRRGLTRRFPYAVYFTVNPEHVSVLAVIHGARHPTRWQDRI
jgi:plasmid stabilization system protein ParE